MIFIRETTQNDQIRLLYKYEKDKKIGYVGGCGHAPASVNILFLVTGGCNETNSFSENISSHCGKFEKARKGSLAFN